MVNKVGNYLCHSLHISGCEYGHIVEALGYGAVVLPILFVGLIFMHRSHH